MEPLEIFFDGVKRSAITVSKKQPFIDWLLFHDKDMEIDDEVLENEVYLLRAFDSKEKMEKWFRKNFDLVFTDQLNGWYTDPTMWPQKRTFKMFEEWFSFSLSSMVWDTMDGMIEKY